MSQEEIKKVIRKIVKKKGVVKITYNGGKVKELIPSSSGRDDFVVLGMGAELFKLETVSKNWYVIDVADMANGVFEPIEHISYEGE